MNKSYHICLSSKSEVLFRSNEDYYRGFNSYALALLKTNSTSLADAFMSNHFHAVVQTDNIVSVGRAFRLAYTMYFNKKYNRIGLNIAYQRKLKKLTQAQLAELVDISRTHISNIEAPNMVTPISLELAFNIADALEIPVDTLFKFE